jgi:oligosaccharide repeat unit polymerase
MRNILIGLYRADEASIEFRVLNTIGLLFFYLASYLYLFGDRYNFLCAASALMFPLLMANRNYILIFLLFVGFKFIYINNKKYFLFFLSIIFFLFNMLYVYIYDKGEGDLNLIFSTFLSLLTYIAVPLHGFSYSVDQHYNYGAYLSLPTSVVSWLGHDVDRNFLYTPYPHQTNVYTLFFSLVHDFGVIGLCISALFFGFFHSLLYICSKRNGLFLILYIYSFYPLIMTFFDNVYTTSLGVWVYILLPVVFLKKKRINISST